MSFLENTSQSLVERIQLIKPFHNLLYFSRFVFAPTHPSPRVLARPHIQHRVVVEYPILGCEVVCWAEPYLLDSGIRLERKLSGSYYLLGWATPNRVTVIIVVVVNSIHSCDLVGSAPCSSS